MFVQVEKNKAYKEILVEMYFFFRFLYNIFWDSVHFVDEITDVPCKLGAVRFGIRFLRGKGLRGVDGWGYLLFVYHCRSDGGRRFAARIPIADHDV
jgi:hypothetical protein